MGTCRDIVKALLLPVDQSLLADVRAEVVRQAAKREGVLGFDRGASEQSAVSASSREKGSVPETEPLGVGSNRV